MRSKSIPVEKASLGLDPGRDRARCCSCMFPLWIIFLYAFTTDEATYTFPLPGLPPSGLAWRFSARICGRRSRFPLQVAAVATLVALVLGTLAAAAVYRSDFFGREAVLLPACSADCPARYRDGHCASLRHRDVWHPLHLLDDRDRSCHVLRGGCL